MENKKKKYAKEIEPVSYTHLAVYKRQLVYRVDYLFLTGFGAHVLVFGGEYDARLMSERFRNGAYIDRSGNVRTAVAYKNADFLHFYNRALPCKAFLSYGDYRDCRPSGRRLYFAYLRNALTIAC